MTQVRDIITAAFRESNIIPLGSEPTSAQQTESLKRLSAVYKSTLGYEVGDQLRDLNLGASETQRNSRDNLEWVDNMPTWWWGNDIIPANVRLVVQIEEPTSVYLDPSPENGAFLAINDPFSLLSANPLTVEGNGRLFEGSPSVTFNTDGINYLWMYRSDLSSWQRLSSLTDLDQEMPFPEEFDDFFITELAIRINPRYGLTLSNESARTQNRMRSEIRSRYKQTRQIPSELGLWYPSWWGAGRFVSGKV